MTFRVQSRMCATCIYRPDSPNDLEKLEREVADPNMRGHFTGHRVCHHSHDACCRGFWNRHKNRFALGQIAQRLGFVEFVEDDVPIGEKIAKVLEPTEDLTDCHCTD